MRRRIEDLLKRWAETYINWYYERHPVIPDFTRLLSLCGMVKLPDKPNKSFTFYRYERTPPED